MQKSIGVPLQQCIKIEDQDKEIDVRNDPIVRPVNFLKIEPQHIMVKKTVTPRDLLVNTVEVAPEDSKSGSNIKNRNQSLKPPLSSRR